MAGLIRVSPANNATYRQWWTSFGSFTSIRQQAEMSRLSAVVEQYRVKSTANQRPANANDSC